MESGHLAILSSKGQLTLPKSLREKLRFETGQRLLLEEMGGGLLVKRAAVHEVENDFEDSEWEELKKLASAKGKVYKSGRTFLHSLKIR